ncbi:MAG: 50S ribosomal protein L3 [Candidatus Eisenbacteria bacterium]|nr:50S ribosomal protein L3 [Candidatus Eisenbacteria bacterium]
MNTLLGKKVGMTQVFSEAGELSPVTVLELGPCQVAQVKSAETDGYEAVQVAYEPVREKVVNKPRRGHFERWKTEPARHLREVRGEAGEQKPGDKLTVEMFSVGELVDVVGRSKGRGFQGVVKRHRFSGGRETHGVKTHDSPGSIGASAYPARVWKGKKLPGHMGSTRVTARNLKVIAVDPERNLLMVKGSVPGSRNSLVMVRSTGRTARG